MYEYARQSGKTIKKSERVIKIFYILVRESVTFLEGEEDRGWVLGDGSYLGGFCVFSNHCDIVLIVVVFPIIPIFKNLLKERLKK